MRIEIGVGERKGHRGDKGKAKAAVSGLKDEGKGKARNGDRQEAKEVRRPDGADPVLLLYSILLSIVGFIQAKKVAIMRFFT